LPEHQPRLDREVLGHLIVVDGHATKNHILPFKDAKTLSLKEAPG
jgi:hypothetical protein